MKSTGTIAVILLLELMLIDKRSEILSCGKLLTTFRPFILNSRETHHWPWHVGIYHQANETYSSYKCGGTLISSNAILTAAHCVSIKAEYVSVSLGQINLDASRSRLIKVGEIFPHPNYNSSVFENDIAIIMLATNAKFNNYVQPICLWPPNKIKLDEVVDKFGTVVGWGVTEEGEVSNALREASLQVVTFIECLKNDRDLYGYFLSDTNYCAGLKNGTGVCTGDSGGSMSFEENGIYRIRGIVSFGPTDENRKTHETECNPLKYSVFTDVAKFLPWIGDVAKVFGSNDDFIPPAIEVEYPPAIEVEYPPGSGIYFRSQTVYLDTTTLPPGS